MLQNQYSNATLVITGLHDIEESILSPKWGMTGRSDASVHVSISAPKGDPESSDPANPSMLYIQSGPMPLEIKTGSNWAEGEHKAQTRLYALLMEERYRMCLTCR